MILIKGHFKFENFLHTTALAVVLFFFISCSEDSGLVRPGAGASLSDQQKRAAADIDAIIGQQLGDTDGLCKGGYGKYEKCFRQDLYRLLTKYYHTSIPKLVNNIIANPTTPPTPPPMQTVFEIDVPALTADDVIYLVADFGISAPNTTGLLFTLELVHIDNDAAQTTTVLATAKSSLSALMNFKRVPMSASYTASGESRPGKFALQVKTSVGADTWNQGAAGLLLDSTSQLTALHYKAFTVDDIFSTESKIAGYYQVEGYSHSTLSPDLIPGGLDGKLGKNTVQGSGKKLLENLNIKNLQKDDILVLRFSGAFDYFDSFSDCKTIPRYNFSFASVKGINLTPMGKSIPASLPNKPDNTENREGDVQLLHGIHVLDILENNPDLNLNIKVDQVGAASDLCKITFRNDANSLALTYELYRPVSKLKENFYLGKFLAEVSSIHENEDRPSTAINYQKDSIPSESFVTTPSVPLMGGDVVFADGSINLDGGVLGTTSGHINSEITLKEVLLGSNTPSSHIIRHSLNGNHSRDHLYVHRALDIFETLIPKGKRQSGRFQVKGKFISGTILDDSNDDISIIITESSAQYRIFRQFDSEDKATSTAE